MSDGTIEKLSPTPRFKGEVLNRIYRVWLFRKLLPVLCLEIVIFSVILYVLGRAVFIQRVIENALNVFFLSPPAILSFLADAFGHASTGTRILTLLGAILLALVIRHLTQGVLRLILIRQNFFGKTEKS